MEIQWETTSCLLCGGSHTAAFIAACDPDLADGPRFTMVRCQDCGLCFLNPRPTAASIGQFYPADYGPHQGVEPSPKTIASARRRMRLPAWWRARNPHRYGLPPSGQCRLLDVGCGGGEFLQRMHAQGWQVTGLDAAQPAVQRVRDTLGLPALAGTLPHAELKPESFEAVTLWHALEHMPRPLETLRHAYDLLVPGGKVLALVPNIAGGPARWFGPAWFGLHLPLHLVQFSPATLRQMVSRAGFAVERLRLIPKRGWLRHSAQLARRMQHGPRWLAWLAYDPLNLIAIEYLRWTRQSDCILVVGTK